MVSGSFIRATFTPKFGLTLQQAAQRAGYDHFNRLNVVTADVSATFCPLLGADLVDVLGTCPTAPYIDPPHGGYLYQATDYSNLNSTICVPPVADNLDWYLDEEFAETFVRGRPTQLERYSAPLNGTLTSLHFLDSPSTSLGGDVQFRTSLVGVKSGGRGEIVAFNGTQSDWRVVGTLFGPDVIERRSTLNPDLGSGIAQFERFVQAGSFSQEEL